MPKLFHHPLDPSSRFIRLALAEYGVDVELQEERFFERRRDFLALNPAGTLPVLAEDNGTVVPGPGPIAEWLDETRGHLAPDRRLMPEPPHERIEVRRLLDWFNVKFFAEVSDWLVTEKVHKRFMRVDQGGGAPSMEMVRAARANIRYHLHYIGYLVARRNFIAGAEITFADLAAAAHLSSVDFLGDVPWSEDETAKSWYARVKSRPSFRTLLADRVPGITPSANYADLDF